MDETVRRAMAKWPDVPAVFGWLSLDARGQWRIRDERIGNRLLNEFIGRNYDADPHGRWFFQNGPQRVFVALALTPWVLRLDMASRLVTHTGKAIREVRNGWIDPEGVVVLDTDLGAAVVDDRDMDAFSAQFSDPDGSPLTEDALIARLERMQDAMEAGLSLRCLGRTIALHPIRTEDIARQLHFVRNPVPMPGELAGC
jgi:hypothetical protein